MLSDRIFASTSDPRDFPPYQTLQALVPAISKQELEYIINHIFLPRSLPDNSGISTLKGDDIFLALITELTREYVSEYIPDDGPSDRKFQCVVRMLQEMRRLHDPSASRLSKSLLDDVLWGMRDGDTVAVYIKAQNAGVIITVAAEETTFETFEVSPSVKEVVRSNRLRMCFPGPSMAIPSSTFHNTGFMSALSSFFSEMYTDYPTNRPLATTTVAKTKVTETRETVMPIYITEFFTGILRGIGREYEPQRFCKRVADEALIDPQSGNAKLPWRRSPLWLVMRVALQRLLSASNDPRETQHQDYKLLMLFVMTRILEIAGGRAEEVGFVSSEILHEMNAKVSRRAAKLSATGLPPVLFAQVQSVVKNIARILSERWSRAQAAYKTHIRWPPEQGIDLQTDTNLKMIHSSGYIIDVLNSQHNPHPMASSPTNALTKTTRLVIETNKADIATSLHTFLQTCRDNHSKRMALADIETWVCKQLKDYVERYSAKQEACRFLYRFAKIYVDVAMPLYTGNPEDTSLMILTASELWAAMDRIAESTCVLLQEYDTPMDERFLKYLLLPKQSLMRRCHSLEEYIKHRKAVTKFNTPVTVDETEVNANTFSVRYFDTSTEHQNSRSEIIKNATTEREAKKAEYEEKRAAYETLRRQIANLSCECDFTGGIGKRVKTKTCEKCQRTTEADNMNIAVHEWPLPSEEYVCKAVIFELNVPVGFAAWRDMTYWLMTKVLCHPSKTSGFGGSSVGCYLESHPSVGLRSQDRRRKEQEITWASDLAPFTNSHQSKKQIQLAKSETDILLPTALRFRTHTRSDSTWAQLRMSCAISIYLEDIRERCTFQLPDAYKPLKYAIESTEHSPNHCIANQRDCPVQEMSLNEYEAFVTLRSGCRLQWWNILREIKAGTLNLNQVEVHLLFAQAIWQTGPPISGSGSEEEIVTRESHLDILEEGFGNMFISALTDLLESVRPNWLKHVVVRTIIILSARVLSLTPSPIVRDRAAKLLRSCRSVTVSWLQDIRDSILMHGTLSEGTQSDVNLTSTALHGWQVRALEIAAVCRSTFNVDSQYLHLVFDGNDDVADLVECSITIQRYTLPDSRSLATPFRCLLERDLRVEHTLEPYLRSAITQHPRCLDAGVERLWNDYTELKNDHGWKNDGVHGWICAQTNDGRSLHYNLLSAELLVELKPFGQLPKEYVNHDTYARIFGNRILAVVSNNNGSAFELTHPVCKEAPNMKVGLTMRRETLIIYTKMGSEVHELIPHKILARDFPMTFITPFAHFFNLNTRALEFRPLHGNLWTELKDGWVVSIADNMNGTPWGAQGSRQLMLGAVGELQWVDFHSPTASAIHQLFEPLENKEYIEILASDNQKKLNVCLPRYKLTFQCELGGLMELSSRSFPGMVIDINLMVERNVGTLYGLQNIFFLRAVSSNGGQDVQRTILIPHGTVSIDFNHGLQHTAVKIKPEIKDHKIDYHHYRVDTILGSLVTNGTRLSHFYKIFLHAITTSCLPDPLTGLTGTEQALDDLRSAISWSFQKPSAQELTVLNWIAQITPRRASYSTSVSTVDPSDRSKLHMERVTRTWPCLPAYAQHEMFYTVVRDIYAHWHRMRFFHLTTDMKDTQRQEFNNLSMSSGGSEPLLKRAAVRHATYLPHAFGGDLSSQLHDAHYISRNATNSNHERRVCQIASLIKTWSTRLDTTRELAMVLRRWGSISLNQKRNDWGDLDDNIQHWHTTKLSEDWFALYDLCRKASREQHTYQLLFLLCSLAYRGEEEVPLQLVHTLLAFATMPTFKGLDPPQNRTTSVAYGLANGTKPSAEALETIINAHRVRFEDSIESRLPKMDSEGVAQHQERLQAEYEANLKRDIAAAVTEFSNQWECMTVTVPSPPPWPLINVNHVLITALNEKFAEWFKNKEYLDHIDMVQIVLNTSRVLPGNLPNAYSFNPSYDAERAHTESIAIKNILRSVDPSDLDSGIVEYTLRMPRVPTRPHPGTSTAMDALNRILTTYNPAENTGFGSRYIADLLKSFRALERHDGASTTPLYKFPRDDRLHENQRQCAKVLETFLGDIKAVLLPSEGTTDGLLQMAGLWPRITVRTLLRQLAQGFRDPNDNSQSSEFYMGWKVLLVTFAELITQLQKAIRLCYYAQTGNLIEFSREVANKGGVGWSSEVYPEWLLFQIENNLLIRPVQAQIAAEMLAPHTGKNSVMQLNMGEGKSSVIVPIVAAALADRTKLVRVIVLKPLWNQMFQLLAQKLGGLLNRRIYYLPFSRRLNLNSSDISTILQVYKECMANGGILLTQPDHLLSFKLIGIYCLSQGDSAAAKGLLNSQRWLDTYSRDIMDESDEILDVKYQLIYTLGVQKPPDLHAERWTIIQEIFDLIRQQIYEIKQKYPSEVELEDRPQALGSFPRTRLLYQRATDELISNLADSIINQRKLKALPTKHYKQDQLQRALAFIRTQKVSQAEAEALRQYYGEGAEIPLTLLLLRGLFALGILRFALQDRRYRVDYGLDPGRTMLAVPYRAKDSPAPRAEFGHPDVAIALTCLSYYYHGLSEAQLKECFKKLQRLANSTQIYHHWISTYRSQLPTAIHEFDHVNIQDHEQWEEHTYPKLRYNKAVVDFYLATSVFPIACKEFPDKLTATGWDLGEQKAHPITGFSGTNDNRYLLPLPVTQFDSEAHLHTNANVLQNLLRAENNHYQVAATACNERIESGGLLSLLLSVEPPVQVLLDVGAQILELDNREVIRTWLDQSPPRWEAGVYFNDDDELTVLSRDGTIEPLILSAYATNLDPCLVFLDEAHTRGTDLRLPTTSRAAVTLGPRLTKDKFVQACMRMRKLGHGQSVMFFAPPEVHAKISKVSQNVNENPTTPLPASFSTSDVIKWVMHETCLQMQRGMGFWASQGISHQSHQVAWTKHTAGLITDSDFKEAWLDKEARTLNELYGVKDEGVSIASLATAALTNPLLSERYPQLNAIRDKSIEFGVINIQERDISVNEEQERELEQEIQVELPLRVKPREHSICEELSRFLAVGKFDLPSPNFFPVMQTLSGTSFNNLVEQNSWCSDLYATADFMNTVKLDSFPGSHTDDFLRRVTWIVSNSTQSTLIIISPYEAQHFLPQFRRSNVVRLHIYSPKVQSDKFCFEDLTYSLPPVPERWTFRGKDDVMAQLNLFAGQLFFSSYESYQHTCKFLGIYVGNSANGQSPAGLQADGWLPGSSNLENWNEYVMEQRNSGHMKPFVKSPVEFIRRLAELRGKGVGIDGTHVGMLVHAVVLERQDFSP